MTKVGQRRLFGRIDRVDHLGQVTSGPINPPPNHARRTNAARCRWDGPAPALGQVRAGHRNARAAVVAGPGIRGFRSD
jgi:hypothetical protein